MHDTVQAVLRDPAFRRSVRGSFADRFLIWLFDIFDKMVRLGKHLPSGRSIGLGIVVLLVLFVVARFVIAARDDNGVSARSARRRAASGTNDPWHDADSLASREQYEDAVHALYRGVIASLGRDERVRLHPSKTSGDYARELRRRGSPSLTSFREFTRAFDVAVYGHGGLDASTFARLHQLSTPFRPQVRAA